MKFRICLLVILLSSMPGIANCQIENEREQTCNYYISAGSNNYLFESRSTGKTTITFAAITDCAFETLFEFEVQSKSMTSVVPADDQIFVGFDDGSIEKRSISNGKLLASLNPQENSDRRVEIQFASPNTLFATFHGWEETELSLIDISDTSFSEVWSRELEDFVRPWLWHSQDRVVCLLPDGKTLQVLGLSDGVEETRLEPAYQDDNYYLRFEGEALLVASNQGLERWTEKDNTWDSSVLIEGKIHPYSNEILAIMQEEENRKTMSFVDWTGAKFEDLAPIDLSKNIIRGEIRSGSIVLGDVDRKMAWVRDLTSGKVKFKVNALEGYQVSSIRSINDNTFLVTHQTETESGYLYKVRLYKKEKR